MCQNKVHIWFTLFSFIVGLICSGDCTSRPIIGVLAQEFSNKNGSFIPASYVKAVEGAGSRPVPIFIGKNRKYYAELLSKINGVVFPGGSTNFHAPGGYGAAGKYIFQEAMKLNDRGIHFPIIGVCQGFQLLATLTNHGRDTLTRCYGVDNKPMNLNFTHAINKGSLYNSASRKDLASLARFNITANFHTWCVTVKNFTNFGMDKFWRMLSTNKDSKNLEFISSMEAIKYPFVAVQFHPEKVAYEWDPEMDIPHSELAIKVNRLFYDWLIVQSKLNNNKFDSIDLENKFLIYNYSPVFTGRAGSYSEQMYEFK